MVHLRLVWCPHAQSRQMSDQMTSYIDTLKHTVARVAELIESLSSHIIAILTRRSCDALAVVRHIPSQYRAMSNKRLPTEPSHFILDVLKPVKTFLSSIPSTLEQDLGPAWATEIFGAVCHRLETLSSSCTRLMFHYLPVISLIW
jgi:conserved oligomeric Golgi complex subunit 2